MKFIDLAFRLGVVFAIFGFLWGIFQLILGLLRGMRPKSVIEEYSFKFVQYFFLVDVTFLFCISKEEDNLLLLNEIIIAATVLLLYFLGKLQNKQQRLSMIKISGMNLPKFTPIYNFAAEVASIVFALGIFVFFVFSPSFARNPISNWFYDSILDIESTVFFGFIFKIIGFFVLLGIIFKLLNGISFLVSGKPLATAKGMPQDETPKKDEFDDFEELN